MWSTGKDVGAPVAEFGEETGHRLGCVISTDDQQIALPSDRILGDHPHPRLHIALVEIGDLFPAQGPLEGSLHAIGGGLDVESHLRLGRNEIHCCLGICFVGLYPVGPVSYTHL